MSNQEHPLFTSFSFWHSTKGGGLSSRDYESTQTKLVSFSTVEEFWSVYSSLQRPDELSNASDYHLFQAGVKPMWEDRANVYGGEWRIRLKKAASPRCWENVILALIGGQFPFGDEITGIGLSTRYNEDILSVWNRKADDRLTVNKIRETIKTVIGVETNSVFEYKRHDVAVRNFGERSRHTQNGRQQPLNNNRPRENYAPPRVAPQRRTYGTGIPSLDAEQETKASASWGRQDKFDRGVAELSRDDRGSRW